MREAQLDQRDGVDGDGVEQRDPDSPEGGACAQAQALVGKCASTCRERRISDKLEQVREHEFWRQAEMQTQTKTRMQIPVHKHGMENMNAKNARSKR